ncbi:MAG TPA: aminodeoxychorismate lyase [Solimonas sp.]|nr:aminodeoxychorismate lyase [Solimonas sp.]
MSGVALYNGSRPGPELAWSRGLHYGDGVFRTLLVWDGEVLDLDLQLDVLAGDAAQLGLDSPPRPLLRVELAQLAQGQPRAVLKLMLLRRAGGRGYQAARRDCDRLLLRSEAPLYPAAHWSEGVRSFISPRLLAAQPQLAGIKHLNRLEQVLASGDWPADADEALLCNAAGNPVCGSRSNLFRVKQGRLLTAGLSDCGIRGMMRRKIIDLAQALQIPVDIEDSRPETLRQADEVLLSNSLIGIWPLRQVDDHCWPAPGPITQRLMAALGHPRLC